MGQGHRPAGLHAEVVVAAAVTVVALRLLGASRLGAAQRARELLLSEANREAETIRREAVVSSREEVSKLRQRLDGDIVVHGSAQLVQTLIEHDLVDQLRVMVFPVVLGTGKRLFGGTSDKKRLRLVDSKTVGDGVAILIYQPSGEQAKASSPN